MNIDDPSFVDLPLGETASYNAGFGWYPYKAPSSPYMQPEYPISTSITEHLAHPVTILPYPDSEPKVSPCFPVTGPTPHSLCKPLAPRSPAADLSSSVPSTYDAGCAHLIIDPIDLRVLTICLRQPGRCPRTSECLWWPTNWCRYAPFNVNYNDPPSQFHCHLSQEAPSSRCIFLRHSCDHGTLSRRRRGRERDHPTSGYFLSWNVRESSGS